MTELREVLSTRSLGGVSVRENIGYTCVAGTGYDCTCTNVQSASAETVQGDGGPVYVMTVQLEHGADTSPLVKALSMTPHRADWYIRNGGLNRGPSVEVSYSLDRPGNKNLRRYLEAS